VVRLNEIKPAEGARATAKRPGRGPGSGLGKTGGRGQKGQKSRSGGSVPRGFEGGQMPLQRRLPKVGFKSRKGRFADEVRLDSVGRLDAEVVDLDVLKAAGLVDRSAMRVKVIASGELSRAVTVKGLAVTKGARAAIDAAGGKVEEA